MSATNDSGVGHGSVGSPQESFEEAAYFNQAEINESLASKATPPKYIPSPKHVPGHSFKGASENPIKTQDEGQHLLDTGYKEGKQIYNITESGKMVKFQPDGSPDNGYHSYEVSKPRDIPAGILKKMLEDGKISKAEYNKYRKGKK
ncbi:MAG: hypothetical protein IJJ74_06600 [Eubacterium sp.]|nr:hypothetical protein [Eubacterium sp.]MBR1675362.1 hypothetical protein [Eubacterium sp.]